MYSPAAWPPSLRRSPTAGDSVLFGDVTSGFDVVAVWVANERSVVTRVVNGPQLRFVEHFASGGHSNVKEGSHGGSIVGGERDVDRPVGLALIEHTEPQGRAVTDPETDHVTEIHQSLAP